MSLPTVQNNIPTWTEQEECDLLAKLAKEVPAGGQIVEIGVLYGGTLSVLAMANKETNVLGIDNFSWTPEGHPQVSRSLVFQLLSPLGLTNVTVWEDDSRRIEWTKSIDLCFIDGGHSLEFVLSDLQNYGTFSKVIALHDYDNPFWPSIREAVETFISRQPFWRVDEVVGQLAVLRRHPNVT